MLCELGFEESGPAIARAFPSFLQTEPVTALLLFFVPALLVWSFLLLRGQSLVTVAMAMLVSEVVFGPPFFTFPGAHAVTINRLVWLLMLGLFALYWYSGLTDPKRPERSQLLLFLFCGYLLLTAILGGTAVEGSNPLSTWLLLILVPLGVYAVGAHSRLSIADLQFLQYALIALGFYLAVTGICEGAGLHSVVFPRFIADPTMVEFFGRARGPLLNPIGNGIFLGTALTAAVLAIPDRGRMGRIVLIVICIVIAAAIFYTKTRSCWMGAVAGLAIIGWIYSPRHLRVWACTATLFFAVIGGVALKDDLLNMKRDKNLSPTAAADSAALRPLLALVAWEMFKDRPLTGVGFRHYSDHNVEYTEQRIAGMPTQKVRPYVQHNVFLALLVETGLIGLTMFSLLLLCWTAKAIGLARSLQAAASARRLALIALSCLAGYVVNGMFHDVSIIPAVNLLLFLLAGILTGTVAREGVLPQKCLMQPRPDCDGPVAVPKGALSH